MSDKFTIAETFKLPSKGLIYENPIKDSFKLRSMTTREEIKRINPSETFYKKMSEVIEDCMVEKPGIPVYDMCVGDFEYALHRLRAITHGADYKLTVTCPNCLRTFEASVSLDDLEIIEYTDELEKLKVFTLPRSGKKIRLNLQTPRTLDEIELRTKEIKRKNKDATGDQKYLLNLLSMVDTVDGEKLSPPALEAFILSLPAGDSNYIIQMSDKLNRGVGLDNTIIVKCDSCGYDVVSNFRLNQEFFGPTID